MTFSLDLYKRELAIATAGVKEALANGTASAFDIAVRRDTAALMADDLKKRPKSLEEYEHRRDEGGHQCATLWHMTAQKRAAAPYQRHEVAPDAFRAKNEEYATARKFIQQYHMATRLVKDETGRFVYLVQENDEVVRVLADISAALAGWVSEHCADDDFLTTPALVGLHRMLSERQDLLTALRLAQQMAKDVDRFVLQPKERPAAVEIVEVAVSIIPIAGTAVAAAEAATGHDLFGYELDVADRCVVAASALLPFAGRFVKGGRALYTAARMERLYGPQAARFSLAVAAGERISARAQVRSALKGAARAGRNLEAGAAKQLVSELTAMNLKTATPGKFMPEYVSDALKKLIRAKPVLGELDEVALMRVADKGHGIHPMKAQLFEELLEARVAQWLRDTARAVVGALGIPLPPRPLEFFPGHILSDAMGRQITDGIIGYRHGGKLVIVAIFEAKAGPRAARELAVTSGSIAGLSAADRAELRSEALRIARNRANQARLAGQPFPKTIAEIEEAIGSVEREFVLSEKGGQVQRDIERLVANADAPPISIWVGEDLMPVVVSPKQTKIFGVLPKDVPIGNMEKNLQAVGYNFEVLRLNVTEKELVDICVGLKPLQSPVP